MKSTAKILMSGLLVLALAIVSCQKEETENDFPIENAQEEGTTIKTGNNNSEIELPEEVLTPILHKRYDGSLTREEAEAQFDIAVADFIKNEGQSERSEAYIYFRVSTKTGTRTHSDADAHIMAWVHFLIDSGDHWVPWFKLDNSNKDDFEKGAYDHFLFGGHVPRTDWIEVKEATVALQGMDGWYVEWFDIHLHADSRYSRASGSSHIWSNPYRWLDNDTPHGWDHYETGDIGRGRLIF